MACESVGLRIRRPQATLAGQREALVHWCGALVTDKQCNTVLRIYIQRFRLRATSEVQLRQHPFVKNPDDQDRSAPPEAVEDHVLALAVAPVPCTNLVAGAAGFRPLRKSMESRIQLGQVAAALGLSPTPQGVAADAEEVLLGSTGKSKGGAGAQRKFRSTRERRRSSE